MPITVIDKIKQKQGNFKLLDSSDINWNEKLPADKVPDNYPNQDKVNQMITNAIGNVDHLKREVLTTGTLPQSGKDNVIYMLPKANTDGQNSYEEYMYTNGKWEKIGVNAVDLAPYAKTVEVDKKINDAKSAAATDAQAKADKALNDAKAYTNQEKAKYLPLAGGTISGKISGSPDPTAETDLANKRYVDREINAVRPNGMITKNDFHDSTHNGAFMVQDKDVYIHGLGSAAFTNSDKYILADDLVWHSIS